MSDTNGNAATPAPSCPLPRHALQRPVPPPTAPARPVPPRRIVLSSAELDQEVPFHGPA